MGSLMKQFLCERNRFKTPLDKLNIYDGLETNQGFLALSLKKTFETQQWPNCMLMSTFKQQKYVNKKCAFK